MLESTTRRRGPRCQDRRPATRDVQVCWANVGRSAPCHTAILQLVHEQGCDVVCVQEPYTHPGTKTSNHPAFACYAPLDGWNSTDPDAREAERPRVMIYVRKASDLMAQQHRPVHSRDLLWVSVNGYQILNTYRQPTTPAVVDYVTNLTPLPKCLIGGDFNARHDNFEPGADNVNRGGELAQWASYSGMDFIGEVGVSTHAAGHVIDLTFSNIAFARTTVRHDLHCGSDHETSITVIPGRETQPPDQHRLRIPEDELPRFAGLVQAGMTCLPSPWTLDTAAQLDNYASRLAAIFDEAILTVGKSIREGDRTAPWWTPECQETQRYWAALRTDESRRTYHNAVRQAKRA